MWVRRNLCSVFEHGSEAGFGNGESHLGTLRPVLLGVSVSTWLGKYPGVRGRVRMGVADFSREQNMEAR